MPNLKTRKDNINQFYGLITPTNFTQLVKHLHQSILPNDTTKQIKNATLKLIYNELRCEKKQKQITNNVENCHLIKFNDMRALIYRPGWDPIKLISIVIGVETRALIFTINPKIFI